MITIIRTSVVIECIYRAVTHSTYRAPEEVAKVDDEVRWNAIYFLVNFFWFEDFGADIYTVVVHESFKLCLEFVTHSLNLLRFDNTQWFTSLNIEKDACIVATIAPNLC